VGALRALGSATTLRPLRRGNVGSTRVVEYAVDGLPASNPYAASFSPLAVPPRATLVIAVDAQHRLRRFHVTRPEAPGGLSTAVDVSYGSPGQVVAPPAQDIAPRRAQGSPAPTGRFRTVAAGSDGGVVWRLTTAAGSRGTRCFRLETSPPILNRLTGRGAAVRCVAPPKPDETGPQDWFEAVFVGGATAATIVAAVAPAGSVTGATALYAGGGDAVARVVPAIGAIVFVGVGSRVVAAFAVTGPGGERSICGPGTAATAREAQAVSAEVARRQQTDFAWSCLTDEDA
jgi:hypothetical protein